MQTPSVSKEFWVFSGVIFVLLCVGVILQLVVFRNVAPTVERTDVVIQEPTLPVENQGNTLVSGTDTRGEFLLEPNSLWKIYTNIAPVAFEVDWLEIPRFISLADKDIVPEMFSAFEDVEQLRKEFQGGACQYLSPDDTRSDWYCYPYLYEVGTIISGLGWEGRSMYLLFLPQEGMGVTSLPYYVLFDSTSSKKFIVIEPSALTAVQNNSEYTQSIWDTENKLLSRILLGAIPAEILNLPQTNVTPQEIALEDGSGTMLSSRYEYMERTIGSFSGWESRTPYENIFGIYDVSTGKMNPPLRTATRFESKEWGIFYMDRNAFVLNTPGGRRLYEYIPYFLQWPKDQEEKNMYAARYIPEINWTDGRDNVSDTFVLGGTVAIGGCQQGVVPFTNIVTNESWFKVSDLKQVGTTKQKGEPVFTVVNPQEHSYYKQLFAYGFEGSRSMYFSENGIDPTLPESEGGSRLVTQTETEKYAQFLADNPVFFWKDSMGNWRVYQKSKYQSMAECGKPVIYLYPEQTTDVNVQVAPNGGFTETIPEYPKGGWNVKAEPNGALTSYDDGQSYPYLFWEGHASGFEYPKQGFVFAQHEVESGMKDVLARFGMNETEIADFLEFWLPKMIEKPYVFVTFADQRAFEAAAPLKITPKPDSVLRVFMYFEGLDVPRTVEPLSIRPFTRTGFSVVEWGGVLVK